MSTPPDEAKAPRISGVSWLAHGAARRHSEDQKAPGARAPAHRTETFSVMSELYDIEARTIDGTTQKLGDYAGKVILVVNVASRCGFTPQYTGLEAIWNENRDKGFVILAFPCNQFSNQEPGTDEEIKTFCSTRFVTTFPLFSKIEVNGENQHPLFKLLKEKDPASADDVKWNFTKFLIDRKGNVVKRFQATNTPRQLEPDILALLAEA